MLSFDVARPWIQAASNVMLAHWIGAAVSLWLMRTVNLPTPDQPGGQ